MLKMTTQRTLLLSFLKKQKKPLTAEMIYSKLPQGTMNLSTVYRSLEAFETHHLIDKSYLGNIAYYHYRTDEHKHFMVCKNCHKMIEIDCHVHDELDKLSNIHHFKILDHDLTIYGLCSTCQTK